MGGGLNQVDTNDEVMLAEQKEEKGVQVLPWWFAPMAAKFVAGKAASSAWNRLTGRVVLAENDEVMLLEAGKEFEAAIDNVANANFKLGLFVAAGSLAAIAGVAYIATKVKKASKGESFERMEHKEALVDEEKN